MIRIDMPAERLSKARWALSPAGELAAALVEVSESPARDPAMSSARSLLRSGRLPTLAAICSGYTVYLPEVLTPHPLSFSPDIDEQLHQLATAKSRQINSQFTAFLVGGAHRRRRCPWLAGSQLQQVADRVHARIETNEFDLREKLAKELHQLWTQLIAPEWSRIAAGSEEFIERHGRLTAREGLGSSLASLHSSLTWRGDALEVTCAYTGRVEGSSALTLVPSRFLRRIGLHAPLQRLGGQLVVPVAVRQQTQGLRIGPVLGATRLALLKSLTQRRTTTELAMRHHLTPGSVSYHLSRLLAADLVQRERRGRLVHYRCTARARTLLRT
ncbi:ArsR/SmtB family transcription factor [Streptomyces sp. NPDC051217]|uniref:ArsR/SmtB family transcription factor n=1 Tax=Streptomyces sp. NPDC051217 TaxID=3365644 RepID=UPI0037B6C62D